MAAAFSSAPTLRRQVASQLLLLMTFASAALSQTAIDPVQCADGVFAGAAGQICNVAPVRQAGLSSSQLLSADGQPIEHTLNLTMGENAAVLLLFDTSVGSNVAQLGGRQAILEENIDTARSLVSVLPSSAQIGVATFDADKSLSVPFTTDSDVVLDALNADEISPQGLNTFLFQSTLDAINELEVVVAQRRLLVLFSDGEAEDEAFTLPEVVTAARDAGVQIVGLASIRQNAELGFTQNLQRLGEETGGLFFRSPVGSGDFAPSVLGSLVNAVGNTATLVIPSASLSSDTVSPPLTLSLNYSTGATLQTSVSVSPTAFQASQGSTPTDSATGSTPIQFEGNGATSVQTAPTGTFDPSLFRETWFERVERELGFTPWYLIGGIAAVISIFLLLFLVARRRGDEGPEIDQQAVRAASSASPEPTLPSARDAVRAAASHATPQSEAGKTQVGPSKVATHLSPKHTELVQEAPGATRRISPGETKIIDGHVSSQTRAIRQARLVVKQSTSGGETKIYDTEATLGRGNANTVVFDHTSVSRTHAKIEIEQSGRVFVSDLSSTNGVFVNDEKVTRKEISVSDKIKLGAAEFTVILPLQAT